MLRTKLEYKYILKRRDAVDWAPGPNRVVQLAPDAAEVEVGDSWDAKPSTIKVTAAAPPPPPPAPAAPPMVAAVAASQRVGIEGSAVPMYANDGGNGRAAIDTIENLEAEVGAGAGESGGVGCWLGRPATTRGEGILVQRWHRRGRGGRSR